MEVLENISFWLLRCIPLAYILFLKMKISVMYIINSLSNWFFVAVHWLLHILFQTDSFECPYEIFSHSDK